REGWIDYIVPQLYWNIGFAAADYAKLVAWWAKVARDSPTQLYVGEALYKAGDRLSPRRRSARTPAPDAAPRPGADAEPAPRDARRR
ncbi:family 10 glycosylhydrolase, partial [Streptomyces sp. NPDC059917]|uniref:family 10 glycosylhydrolase n=1 Tax=Streptomyces sp. NPDC059917 TaxID=3347002 RepID=UPI00365A63F2